MDIGAEISKKIQMAITAKLKELNAYVDDELPDYIMIMVANKKSEAQMTEALSLFLSNNTKTFTAWLHNLLSSLRKGKGDRKPSESLKKEVTSPEEPDGAAIVTGEDNQGKKKTKKTSNDNEKIVSQISNQSYQDKIPSEAIITIDHEMHDVFDEELLAESSAAELLSSEKVDDEQPQVKPPMSSSVKLLTGKKAEKISLKSTKSSKDLKRKSSELTTSQDSTKSKKDRPSKSVVEKHRKQEKKSARVSRQSSKSASTGKNEKPVREWDRGKGDMTSNDQASSNWYETQLRDRPFYSDSEGEGEKRAKTVLSSTVNQMHQDSEFVSDSDSENDSKSKISSRVAYPKRKMRVPLSKQANRALFMKAVNAAEKSVNTNKATASKRETSPISTKVEKRVKKSTSSREGRVLKNKQREFPDNDARRKLEIRRAVGQVLYSEIVGKSKQNSLQDRLKSDNFNAAKSSQTKISAVEEQVKDDAPQKPRPQKSGKSAAENNPPPYEVEMKGKSFADQRKFIIQDDESPSVPSAPLVAFDSRQTAKRQRIQISTAKPIHEGPPSDSTSAPPKTQDKSGKAPNFIVTLDGVIRSKHTVEQTEEEKKAARLEKFKYAKITMGSSGQLAEKVGTIPKQKDIEQKSAMSQLQMMEKKIEEVQKESTKLRQMQVKLASIQANQLQPTADANPTATSEDGQRSIFVANVHYSTSEKQLSDYFSICGKVVRATILKDNVTGHPKGFAYLEFEDKHAVSSALALNNTQLNNRVIRVTLKQPTNPVTSYRPIRAHRSNYRGRPSRPFLPRFRQNRFARFRSSHMVTRNKTWVNPAIIELTK